MDVEAPIDEMNHGVFVLNQRITYDDVSDGASHTIFIGEKLNEPVDLGWMSGTRATLRNTGSPINMIGGKKATWANGQNNNVLKGLPASAVKEQVEMGMTDSTSSAPESDTGDETADLQDGSNKQPPAAAPTAATVGGFASWHPGGANFSCGDGSVKFISEFINTKPYQQLGHRADGQLPEFQW